MLANLKFLRKVRKILRGRTTECSPPQTCQVSGVRCHVSGVTCHVSHVTCHMSRVTCHMYFFLSFFFWQGGEVYRWWVCYQWGLPRLVLAEDTEHLESMEWGSLMHKCLECNVNTDYSWEKIALQRCQVLKCTIVHCKIIQMGDIKYLDWFGL